MKIINCEQGTPEWFNAKTGVPSASNFDSIVTTKGIVSKSKTKYLYRLAGEKVSGIIEETYQNAAMLRGIEMEHEARNLYSVLNDVTVEEVGFCLSEGKYVFGASPDGLVESDGGIEIKCPTQVVHVEYLLDNKLPTKYFQQVQGCLLVTGRKWWDFMSYYPGIKPLIIRVERDEKFIEALSTELKLFCLELNDVIEKISE